MQCLCETNIPLFLGLPSVHLLILLPVKAASPAKPNVNMEVLLLHRGVSPEVGQSVSPFSLLGLVHQFYLYLTST